MDLQEEGSSVMSDEGDRKAHALSLHLHSILTNRAADGASASDIVTAVQEFLKNSGVEDHLDVAVNESSSKVELKGRSEFGDSMVLELYSRCESFPCPEGECEYASRSFCKSCGKLKR